MADPKPGSQARRVVLAMPDQLRHAIQESGLSYCELARQAGISDGQVSRFMSGDRDLHLETAGRICSALGLSLAASFRPKGRPRKPAG